MDDIPVWETRVEKGHRGALGAHRGAGGAHTGTGTVGDTAADP